MGQPAALDQPTATVQPAAVVQPKRTLIRAEIIKTMAKPVLADAPASDNTIRDGIILIEDGLITYVGPATGAGAPTATDANTRTITTKVATPGLIDGRSTVGLSGLFNTKHDSDQLERSAPLQPELRAIDAFNAADPLVAYVRSLGITTIHTGHAPGELISGQTMIVKTVGGTVEASTLVPAAMVTATLGPSAQRGGKEAPGTRSKQIAMLRAELIKAQEHKAKRMARANAPAPAPATTPAAAVTPAAASPAEPEPLSRDLRVEALIDVLDGKLPLLITANAQQDIMSALRLAAEFKFTLVLDSAAEAQTVLPELVAAKVRVIAHPPMMRAYGELKNISFTTPAALRRAGIPFTIQSGYESYVPKTRIVLFEAAISAANGLSGDEALAMITRDAAEILNISSKVGSLEVGKHGDVACFDGDPFEYTTHVTATVINGVVFEQGR